MHIRLAYKWEVVMLPCQLVNNFLALVTTVSHINAGPNDEFTVPDHIRVFYIRLYTCSARLILSLWRVV